MGGKGILNRGEAKQLVQGLVDATSARLTERLEKLKEAREDPKQVDALLSAFDISGDGKVEKDEFIQKAMEGYQLHLDSDNEVEDDEDGEVEPPAKKPRTKEGGDES